jgi:hypothetical protein
MTHIVCRAISCLFWDQGICGSEEIEYEPDTGCLTFQDMGDLELAEEDEDEFDWEDSDDTLFSDDEDDWEEDDDDWDNDWEEDDL